jgi:DNA-binding MarR family transcriptional regulator
MPSAGRSSPQPSDGVDIEPLVRASQVIAAAVVRSLASVEPTVTVPQLRVLVMLSVHGKMNLSSVAERLGVNASNASRTCERLVTASLIERREDSRDRRHIVLSLAQPGRRLVRTVMRRREELLATVVQEMSPRDQETLMTALAAFNTAAGDVASTGVDDHGHGAQLMRWLA